MARTFGYRRLPLPLAITLCCVCVGAVCAQTGGIASDATFRSTVTEVRLTFSATDQNDHILATVQPTDFAIVDQGIVVRDFRSFTRSEYTQLAVAVLVDASGSITPQFQQELANVVQVIAQTNGVPDESFSVVSFRDLKPAVVCDGNCRALNASSQFPVIKSGGMTPLYDSVVYASRALGRVTASQGASPHIRKILILFSDGADTISLRSLPDALNSALTNEVAIYAVDTSPKPHTYPGTLVLHSFSFNTGGRYFPLEAGAGKLLDAILEDFHAAYTVAYKLPDRATGFHEVRILSTHSPSLQFHCRRGYYYPNTEN